MKKIIIIGLLSTISFMQTAWGCSPKNIFNLGCSTRYIALSGDGGETFPQVLIIPPKTTITYTPGDFNFLISLVKTGVDSHGNNEYMGQYPFTIDDDANCKIEGTDHIDFISTNIDDKGAWSTGDMVFDIDRRCK